MVINILYPILLHFHILLSLKKSNFAGRIFNLIIISLKNLYKQYSMKLTKTLLISAVLLMSASGLQAAGFIQKGNYLTVQLKQHQNFGPHSDWPPGGER